MSLVWKLLRQHISPGQFVGFFFANLFGVMIVLFGFQFYRDVIPVFTAGDSFMKANYMIISKAIGTGSTLSGRSNTFSAADVSDISEQPFCKGTGAFTSAGYRVEASMGIGGKSILNSEIFIESVPDKFVDVDLGKWKYEEGSQEVPIILPRSYMTMYNFGFAQTHSMPKISEGLVGMIDFSLFVNGDGKEGRFKGKVIGFSSRLNSILVPETFMKWSNSVYAPQSDGAPTRLIVEVDNPTDNRVSQYMESMGYDTADNNMDAEKITYFLRLLVTVVIGVGLVISALSFYILMLSIYLLVEKNARKLENLLLIGYSTGRVAMPYQLLTLALNALVLLIATGCLAVARSYYMEVLLTFMPTVEEGSMMWTILLGLAIFAVVSVFNIVIISNKVRGIWNSRR